MLLQKMHEIDADGSGCIDFSEFCTFLQLDDAPWQMRVRSAESSAELWLSTDGFVFLANQDKVCLHA